MSNRIPEDAISTIREAADLSDVVRKYNNNPSNPEINLVRTADGYKMLCPFHNEKTPSFHIQNDRQLYYCFGCGEGGNVFQFTQKLGLAENFPEAVKLVASWYPNTRNLVELPRQLPRRLELRAEKRRYNPKVKDRKTLLNALEYTKSFYLDQLLKSPSAGAQRARTYLDKRGIPESLAEELKMGYAPANDVFALYIIERLKKEDGLDYHEAYNALRRVGLLSYTNRRVFSDRLTLPVATLEREVVGFNARRLTERKETTKYKNSPEGEIFSKRDVLFGSEFIDPDYVRRYGIILVEGQLDTLGFLVQGHRNVAAISSTILTYEHIELIKRLNPQNIYLMCDGDKPGIRGSIKNANSLLASHLYSDISIVPIHERGKDPFDVFFTDKQLAFRYIEREALKPIDFVKRCNPEDLVDDGTNGDKLRFLRENTGSILRRDDLKEMGFDLYS